MIPERARAFAYGGPHVQPRAFDNLGKTGPQADVLLRSLKGGAQKLKDAGLIIKALLLQDAVWSFQVNHALDAASVRGPYCGVPARFSQPKVLCRAVRLQALQLQS